MSRALKNPVTFEARLIPDEQAGISAALIELVDAGCSPILTTGGTGPSCAMTPEATLAVADKEMPGFGEQMRQISLSFVPTAFALYGVIRAAASSSTVSPKRDCRNAGRFEGCRRPAKVNGILPLCLTAST
ncbi:hypothetical protein J4711_13730 [Staphylococcus epidermidis]|nr:hypothetical protein [Staphylococcus epidermidis]